MIANALRTIADLYGWVLIARVIVSWLPVDPFSPWVRFLHEATEPVLAPIRRVLPPLGGFDLSPMVALLLLELVKRAILG